MHEKQGYRAISSSIARFNALMFSSIGLLCETCSQLHFRAVRCMLVLVQQPCYKMTQFSHPLMFSVADTPNIFLVTAS